MSTFFRGGVSKVEYDDNVNFSSATEIPNIMKDQTNVEFDTPTEELANGLEAGAAKGCKLQIRSSDLTAAVYTELIAAEAAMTPMFFRLTGINPAQKLIVKNVIPIVELKPAEAGKFWGRVVRGRGFADTEANLASLTLA